MIFWVLSVAATLAVLYVVIRPLMGRDAEADAADAAAYDLAVYKSQLREIDGDLERGRISEEEAEASRVEIGRRVLAADRKLAEMPVRPRAVRGGSIAAGAASAVIAGSVLAAIIVYDRMGDPSNPDMPLVLRDAERQMARTGGAPDAAAQEAGDLDSMAARLRERLNSGEGTAEDWALLGRTEMMRGNYAASAQAYSRALRATPDDPELNAAYGEALIFANNGEVVQGAFNAFRAVLEINPTDPRARFYIGEFQRQNGFRTAALDIWIDLLNDAQPGAGWTQIVRDRAEALAAELEVDLDARLAEAPAAPGGPTAEDMAAAQDMTPEERQEMIRGMVEGLAARLEEDPSDFDGWMRLIRSRMVLGETEAAQAALDNAAGHFADAPIPMGQLSAAAAELGLQAPVGAPAADGTAESAAPAGPTEEDMAAAADLPPEERAAMVEGMVDNLAARLAENPDDLRGWMMLGRSYTALGRTEEAIAALARASDLAPDDTDLILDRARLMRTAAGERQTPETVALMRDVLAKDPDNLEALWFLGLDAVRDGDRAAARDYFDRAISQLPPGSEERASLQSEIDRLFNSVGN
jgi:cytochrome c-type biogenesis protein CcmH